jgi:L-alanine-DL-glutamate epimerase-like enolase superfamily enzyme
MLRRTFLATSAASVAALRASVPEWEQPLFNLHKVSGAPVKISAIDILQNDHQYLIRTRAADGAEGIVKAKDPIQDYLPILQRRVIPFFLGQDARDLEALIDGVYIKNYKLAGQPFWLPVGAVEQSILDLLGHVAKKPVAELLGGVKRKEIPVYLSGSGRETTADQEVDVYVRGVELTGARAVKFKIGGRMSRNADAYPGRTETMLKLARQRLGDQVTLYADANGSYDAAKAIEVGKLLQDLNFKFFEEPCPWEELSETKKVADVLQLQVAAGEQDASLWRFDWMLQNGVMDIAQPDLNYNGGLIRAARVARIARKYGAVITPHNTETAAAGAKILHFASAMPNAGPHMEWSWRKPAASASWYSPNLDVKNGVVSVPIGPGFGIEYDSKYLAGSRVLSNS